MRDLLLSETFLLSGGDSDHQCDDDHDDHDEHDHHDKNHSHDFDFTNWFS